MLNWFRPSIAKLAVFVVFLVTLIGGTIESSLFSMGPTPLARSLSGFPFWWIWVLLSMPLWLIAVPLRMVGLDLLGHPWLLLSVSILYFYTLACLLVQV